MPVDMKPLSDAAQLELIGRYSITGSLIGQSSTETSSSVSTQTSVTEGEPAIEPAVEPGTSSLDDGKLIVRTDNCSAFNPVLTNSLCLAPC